jgi:hypothetical protein
MDALCSGPMNTRLLAHRALKSSLLALLVCLALGGSVAAAATNPIEGTWSFGGGAVDVHAAAGGFEGVVVTPTTFAKCVHPEGQVMWTEMHAQADGSFWGKHQWYGDNCELDTHLGLTAWRVLRAANGDRTLKVCFSLPESESQPTIDSSGKEANATYGCSESAPLGPLPVTEGPGSGSGGGSGQVITFANTVVLPNAKACVSQRSLKLSLRDPKYDPLKEVLVRINGRKVADVRGVKRLKKGVVLGHLPSGTYKVSVLATTVLNQHLTGASTYHSCTKGSGKINLHGSKPHH